MTKEPHVLRGGCHCGAIRVELRTRIAPEALTLRACACTFCRKHGAATTADPGGHVRITLEGPASRYRWGLATADFLVCPRCGVYVAAVLSEGGAAFATVNTRALDDQGPFQREAVTVSYEGETPEQRIARRRKGWTPAQIG